MKKWLQLTLGILTSIGGQDIYIAKFSPSGVYKGSQRYGDYDDQYPKSVATDAAGNALITRSEERRLGKEGRSRWSPYH